MSSGRIPKSDPMEGRLQDMLRYNMEKYAGQALDTLATSRRVRELLSIHNIGQRLFAKYVLGLSQGTVSELLSKPKSWEKLTEKGRDSYRKMHAWAYDDQAVMMLKSLIPRKGELVRPVAASPLLIKGKRKRKEKNQSFVISVFISQYHAAISMFLFAESYSRTITQYKQSKHSSPKRCNFNGIGTAYYDIVRHTYVHAQSSQPVPLVCLSRKRNLTSYYVRTHTHIFQYFYCHFVLLVSTQLFLSLK